MAVNAFSAQGRQPPLALVPVIPAAGRRHPPRRPGCAALLFFFLAAVETQAGIIGSKAYHTDAFDSGVAQCFLGCSEIEFLYPPFPYTIGSAFSILPGQWSSFYSGGNAVGNYTLSYGYKGNNYGVFLPRFPTPVNVQQTNPTKAPNAVGLLWPAVLRIDFLVSFFIGPGGLPGHTDSYAYPIAGVVGPDFTGTGTFVFVNGFVKYFVNGIALPLPNGVSQFGPFFWGVPGPYAWVVQGTSVVVPPIAAGGVLTLAGTLIFATKGDDGSTMEIEGQTRPDVSLPFQLSLPATPQTNVALNGFHFLLAGDVNQFYVVQSSTNFVTWTNLQTVQLTSDPMEIVDHTVGNGPARFYRAELLPGGPGGTNFVVTAGAGPHGTITPTNAPCVTGGNATFTATADTNYVVAQWFVDQQPVAQGGSSFTLSNVQDNAGVLITFQPANDLAVSISGAPDPVVVSNQLSYTITITNSGINTSHNVTVSNSLPAGVSLVSANTSQGSCSSGAGVVTCALGDLPAGLAATLTITGSPTAAGNLTDLVNVWADEFEPMTNNNYGGWISTAVEVPTITAQPQSQSVSSGTNVNFSVTATNAMPVRVVPALDGNSNLVMQTNSPGTLSYQWFFYGTNLPAATNQVLTLLNVTTNDAGPFTVVVSNAATNVLSDVANLTVTP